MTDLGQNCGGFCEILGGEGLCGENFGFLGGGGEDKKAGRRLWSNLPLFCPETEGMNVMIRMM